MRGAGGRAGRATSATARACASGSAPTRRRSCSRVHAELLGAGPPGARRACSTTRARCSAATTTCARLHALVRTARVVSIVGPGGLGKTRLAHVVGRHADAAGRALRRARRRHLARGRGRRGRLGARRPRLGQRAARPDRRAARRRARPDRPAARPRAGAADPGQLRAPASRRSPTWWPSWSRRPATCGCSPPPGRRSAIAAERVYLLGELGARRRGRAVPRSGPRPPGRGCGSTTDGRPSVVARLDGLPLAIELAAAKVRVMSVEEIARRLEDRFALLRGGDRTRPRPAPDAARGDRLVLEPARRAGAARRCAGCRLFRDGFTLDGGRGACSAATPWTSVRRAGRPVAARASRETRHGVRYRMLETVREFGRMQLADAGEDAARRGAAAGLGDRPTRAEHGARLFGPTRSRRCDARPRRGGQPRRRAARRRSATADPATAVQLLRGARRLLDRSRATTPGGRARRARSPTLVAGWTPPPELVDVDPGGARRSTLINSDDHHRHAARRPAARAAARARARRRTTRGSRRWCTVLLAYDRGGRRGVRTRLARARRRPPTRDVAGLAAAVARPRPARTAATRRGAIDAGRARADAAATTTTGRGRAAMLHAQLAGLHMQLGEPGGGGPHAAAALPGAGAARRRRTTRSSCASLLLLAALADGDLDEADGRARRARPDRRAPTGVSAAAGAAHVRPGRARARPRRGGRRARGCTARASERDARRCACPGVAGRPGWTPWVLFARGRRR